MKITPTSQHLLIKPEKENKEIQTKGGIIVQDEYTKREDMQVHLKTGEVIAIGKDIREINVGDTVYYNPFDAHSIDEFDLCPLIGIRACRPK